MGREEFQSDLQVRLCLALPLFLSFSHPPLRVLQNQAHRIRPTEGALGRSTALVGLYWALRACVGVWAGLQGLGAPCPNTVLVSALQSVKVSSSGRTLETVQTV